MQTAKVVVVGDGGVGKSCLLISYTTNSFPGEYVPTVFDNYSANIMVDGKSFSTAFFDTAGQEDYDRLRPLTYPQTDVFLVCFSIANRSSLSNVKSKWVPELQHHCPDVPKVLVGCKSDCRSEFYTRPTSDSGQVMAHDEIQQKAKELGMVYVETSALTQAGVKNCFEVAIRQTLSAASTKYSKKTRLFSSRRKSDPPIAPVMPPAGRAPRIEILTAQFADDWRRMLQQPCHSDVTFIVTHQGGCRIDAHRVMLCAASRFFRRVFFNEGTFKNDRNKLRDVLNDMNFTQDDVIFGRVPGIASLRETKDGLTSSIHVEVELSEDVDAKSFSRLLEFLYTGVVERLDSTSESDRDSLIRIVHLFRCEQLETVVLNFQSDEDFLNPSIGTYLNDETGRTLRDYFLNQSHLADIIFTVEGRQIYAHKAVVSARNDVMAGMFAGSFVEGLTSKAEVEIIDTTYDEFLAFLEYIYTDHAPIEDNDCVGILRLADKFCIPRLISLCELYITFEVDRSVSKNIEKSNISVINLLLGSQQHNAVQLQQWCLHFIASNYTAFRRQSDFNMLKDDNLQYVEKNRWPPIPYLEAVEQYEKELAARNQTCLVM